jgi:hypothetical protein
MPLVILADPRQQGSYRLPGVRFLQKIESLGYGGTPRAVNSQTSFHKFPSSKSSWKTRTMRRPKCITVLGSGL